MTPSGVLPVFCICKLNGFSMSSSGVCYLFFTLERGLLLLSWCIVNFLCFHLVWTNVCFVRGSIYVFFLCSSFLPPRYILLLINIKLS